MHWRNRSAELSRAFGISVPKQTSVFGVSRNWRITAQLPERATSTKKYVPLLSPLAASRLNACLRRSLNHGGGWGLRIRNARLAVRNVLAIDVPGSYDDAARVLNSNQVQGNRR